MGTFSKFYDKVHIFRAKYGSIDFALGRWTTTVGQNAPKSMRAHARQSCALVKTFFSSLTWLKESLFRVILVFAAKSTNLTRLPNPTVVQTNESTCDATSEFFQNNPTFLWESFPILKKQS